MPQIILLFPGQGSQVPGMAKDVHDAFPAARQVLEECEDAVSLPLRRIMFSGSADELRDTRYAQLALFAHGAAMIAVIRDITGSGFAAAAGHSVGEYAAVYAAGSLSLTSAVRLVAVRGSAMAAAGELRAGAMAALIGELQSGVEEICEAATEGESVVVPANFNAPGQVVVSGSVDAVERAMQIARDRGARKVVRLNVSGAFHSPLMAGAQDRLIEALHEAPFGELRFPVYSNVTARPVLSGTVCRELLERQLQSPVRWVESVRNVERDFPESLCLEAGPGSVLAGLVKRSAESLRTVPCGTVADVDSLSKVAA